MNEPRLISLDEHPRAAPAIRRAKARGGLAGFLIVAVVGIAHGSALSSSLVRALGGGLVAYLLTWAATVAIWRQVLTAQAAAAVRRASMRRAEAAAAAAEAARAAAAAAMAD